MIFSRIRKLFGMKNFKVIEDYKPIYDEKRQKVYHGPNTCPKCGRHIALKYSKYFCPFCERVVY